jgi:hypothetical protein
MYTTVLSVVISLQLQPMTGKATSTCLTKVVSVQAIQYIQFLNTRQEVSTQQAGFSGTYGQEDLIFMCFTFIPTSSEALQIPLCSKNAGIQQTQDCCNVSISSLTI